MVISKGSTDPGTATQLRFQLEGDLQYTEYVQPFAPSVFGHPTAKGASAVAAYDPFRPTLPEDFTSVGGDLPILFDSAGNRFAQPQIRRKPDVAATDGGNTTFFVSDAAEDDDNLPNFFGTSAAAPHAAAIAALVLQARGGPGSVSPTRMRSILQGAAFPHDLDPSHSEASSGGLTITADGAQGDERRGNPTLETVGSMNDPGFFRVQYSGPGSIVSLTLDGAGADPTGLGRAARRSVGGPRVRPAAVPRDPGAGRAGPVRRRASRSRSAPRARASTRPRSPRSSRGRASGWRPGSSSRP